MIKWEYKIYDTNYLGFWSNQKTEEGLLNRLGNEGWELVSIIERDLIEDREQILQGRKSEDKKKYLHHTFKRQKQK